MTWVSEGKDFRRLRLAVKAGEVVEVAMLAHGSLLSVWTGAAFYHPAEHPGKAHAATISSRTAGFCR